MDRLTVTNDLEAAVAPAEFIQESAPERLELKQALYKQLGQIVPADVVISSSTSGLTMTDIQKGLFNTGAHGCGASVQSALPFAAGGNCRWREVIGRGG